MYPEGRKRGGLDSFIKVLDTLQVMEVCSRWAVGRFLPRTRIFGSQVGQRCGCSNFLFTSSRRYY